MRSFLTYYLAPYLVVLAILAALSGSRLTHGSAAPQFVYQADAWLHGSLAIEPPLRDQDWAKLRQVTLDTGEVRMGRRLATMPNAFRTTLGETLPTSRITSWGAETVYMSFPPFPALVMLPVAATAGRDGNDVAVTLVIAALIAPLCMLFLRRLRREVHGELTSRASTACPAEQTNASDVWLTAALVFGTVLFYAALGGKVWYTAHIIAIALCLIYATASLGARYPFVAGLAFAAATLSRTPMVFMLPFFGLELLRLARATSWRHGALVLLRFALPVAVCAAVAMWLNAARFGSPTEFGHTYLDARQAQQIEQYGLFSYHYLSRNLSVALTLLPTWLPHAPWISISGHGLALWVTSPFLLWLLARPTHAARAPDDRTMLGLSGQDALFINNSRALTRAMAISAACVALPALFYQNSGWVQFGYRFSLDYMVFLIGILALAGAGRARWFRAAIVLAIAINLFGALTFDRDWRFYNLGTYPVIIAN